MKIDTDIPPPKPRKRGAGRPQTEVSLLAGQLGVGHSILVQSAVDAECARGTIYRKGGRPVSSKKAGKGWRIWRVE